MRRLIFINRFFFPDHSATSQILSDLAFHLAGAARDVHVVTSRQIYDDPKASLPADEIVESVHVHRVHSTQFGRSGLVGRSIDYFSFYRSVWRYLGGMARQDDIVIAKTDPPLMSIVAMAAGRRSGAQFVNWLQDIYPELAVELGVPLIRGPVAAGLAAARNRSLRLADATVAVGDLMGQKVVALGASPARVHVIPNWCDDEAIRPFADTPNPLREAWGLQEKFVVGYSGNLGRAHDFATVLATAERLRNDRRMVFLMIGGGRRFDDLAGAVKDRGLDASFRFVAYQERATLAYSLAVPDVHWLSLNPSLEGLIVPSKFYGIAAAGKPIIVIGANDGELARLVRKYGCGTVVAPGDGVALAATVSRLASNPASVVELGVQARRMLEMNFTRKHAFERWRRLLDALDQQSGAQT